MDFVKYKEFTRREVGDQEKIKGAIRLLEEMGMKVIIYENFIALLFAPV